ncbi:MAG: MCE family protein [Candidatus Saganbacteria bacterium]|nr:MCE family protein [Candidatus Saganbacteria bacterium]
MKLSTLGKVGVTTIAALVALAIIISWKSEIFLIRGGYKLVGSFKNIEGLTIGSEVRYRGFNVGKIMGVDPTPKDIRVNATIKRGIKIPQDSKLRVAFDGLVGMKYLEIRPGESVVMYKQGDILGGISTAGIVDFIDIGSKNLQETKAILENVRKLVEDPQLQHAFKGAILTANQVTIDIQKLTQELRATNRGIMAITTDPKFQLAVKGTVAGTDRTLTSANNFFESFSRMNLRPSGDILLGSSANQVRGNLDITQGVGDYLRFGIGEGPTRNLGLQDILLTRKISGMWGMKLGMMNSRLGGGIDMYGSPTWLLSTDVYDINNPKPKLPKFRLTSAHGLNRFVDMVLQADDLFNSERNYSLGLSVKGSN